ncbi:alpha/beta hydrolase family protein [Vibrio mangrovi]|uniref:Alpha/beta fold hydrolase n=1 Tax=Vibrio mangrovi TaxID=474394 RepID=A0A1Y6IQ32_9VIBR|nr:alpha/beta fold hydrolase [Vibrio mangrovi]MDW6003464.1 alpha/beta fold hydrolase [Vibrio mangrovi]SMR99745.1 Prolyl oligopeptidase family protein [Vibrio mangrovi]
MGKQFPSIEQLLNIARPDRVALCPAGRMVSYSQLVANPESDQFERVGFVFDSSHNIHHRIIETGNIRQFLWLSTQQLLVLWDQGRFDDRYHLYSLNTDNLSDAISLRQISPLEIRHFTAFQSGVIFSTRDDQQLHYIDLTTSTHLTCEYSDYGDQVISLISNKLSPDICAVTLSGKEAGINHIYQLTISSSGKLQWLPVETPEAYDLCAKAFSDCNQWLFVQGKAQNKRYAQQLVWQISQSGYQCLTKNLDRDAEIIGYGNQGLLIRYVDQLSARLAFVTSDNLTNIQMEQSSRIDADISGMVIAFIGQSHTTFPEIYRLNMQDGMLINISQNTLALSDFDFGQTEQFNWLSSDGLPLQGVLRFTGDKTRLAHAPLAVVIHGGPKDFSEHQLFSQCHWYAPYLALLARGYVILEPNYRGSLGRGQEFTQANIGAIGVMDRQDICSAVETLAQHLSIDRNNTVCIGWSQGGFIAAYSGFHSQIFSKIIAGAAISDWYTYARSTDIPDFVDDYLPHSKPLTQEQLAASSVTALSPQNKPATLIFHGQDDFRVPPICGRELLNYCKTNQVKHQGYFIEGMKHRIERPSQMKLVLEKTLQWLLEP